MERSFTGSSQLALCELFRAQEVIREAIREVIREAIREGITLSPAAVGESARSTRAADGDPASRPYAHTN